MKQDKVVTVTSPYQPYRARLSPPSRGINQALRAIATTTTATTTTATEAISSTADHHITTLGHANSIQCRSALCTGFSFSQSKPSVHVDVKLHDTPSSPLFDPEVLQVTVRPTSLPILICCLFI